MFSSWNLHLMHIFRTSVTDVDIFSPMDFIRELTNVFCYVNFPLYNYNYMFWHVYRVRGNHGILENLDVLI